MQVSTNHEGAVIVTELVSDGRAPGAYLHSRTYYGYTKAQARRMFAEYLKSNGMSPERY